MYFHASLLATSLSLSQSHRKVIAKSSQSHRNANKRPTRACLQAKRTTELVILIKAHGG